MKNNQKGFIVPLLIAVIALLVIGGGVYIYKNSNRVKPLVKDIRVSANYQILNDESLWRLKYVNSNTPMQWDITEKGILLKEVQQNKFFCGDKEAQFIKYSSFNDGSLGGWNNISVVDCLDYYFVYEFGDSGPKLYGPFNK